MIRAHLAHRRADADRRVLAALRHSTPVYGYDLWYRTGVPPAWLYPALGRLERAGLVVGEWESAEPGARRLYRAARMDEMSIAPRRPAVNAPEPPPSDNGWLRSEDIRATRRTERPPDPRGGYVYRPSDHAEPHRCPLPAEWEDGAVWRCPEGHLWVVDDACGACRTVRTAAARGHGGQCTVGLAWWPATWWQRRRHGGITIGAATRARLDMANGNRVQSFARMKEPPSALLQPPQDYDG